MSTTDLKLTAAAIELLKRLEATLPPGYGAMFQFYNTQGVDLDLTLATLGRHDPGDALRVLQVVREQYAAQHRGHKRRYVCPVRDSPSEHAISSAEVLEAGAHEVVRLWSRGGFAGEIVVSRGDGARICCTLLMLDAAEPAEAAPGDVP